MSIFLGASGLLNQIVDHSSNAKTSLCLDCRSIESSAILSCFSGLKIRLEEGMVNAGVEHVTGFPPNLGAAEGGDVNSLTSKIHVPIRLLPEGVASGDGFEFGVLLVRLSLDDDRTGETCFNGFNG